MSCSALPDGVTLPDAVAGGTRETQATGLAGIEWMYLCGQLFVYSCMVDTVMIDVSGPVLDPLDTYVSHLAS